MNVRKAINVIWSLSLYMTAVSWIQLLAFAEDASSEKKPSLRYIITSEVEIFAGPGTDFYPTAVLKSGQAIEVHQETSDGWLAITPPPGSFSWLPAANGLLLPGGRIVEVTEKSAVSWIGSSLGTAKQYRWQVKLTRGQQLSVTGEQTIEDQTSGSKSLWYKITPPTGEFRWIPAKATSDQPPPSSTENIKTNSSIVDTGSEQDVPTKDSNVVPASAEQGVSGREPATMNNSRTMPRSSQRKQTVHQHSDQWAEWHAMEFKNGSFSFPGLSRMLGMPPTAPATTAARNDDPFDLTADYSRTNPKTASSARTKNVDSGATLSTEDESHLTVRQSRGWRDPRQLRAARERGSLGNGAATEETETMLANDDSQSSQSEVMDASFLDTGEDAEIGSAVITAGANEPVGNRSTNQTISRPKRSSANRDKLGSGTLGSENTGGWYGIEQAPADVHGQPKTIGEANLEEIQVELSAMVAGPEHTWNLSPLADRTRYFIEHGRDSIERGQARLLLERIESFGMIARNSAAVGLGPASRSIGNAALTTSTNPGNVSAVAASWNVPKTNVGSSEQGSTNQFDATGWLVPVHSSGRDMPTHALTNDTGRIIVYVTPAPGVNLTRFESQPIGVYGLRGYLPQLKSNHIQIQRVVRLQ